MGDVAAAEPGEQKVAEIQHDFSTLAVYTYKGALTTQVVPRCFVRAAMPQVLKALFGPRKPHSVFSLTASSEGDFVTMDVAQHTALFGGSAPPSSPNWSCLYIHEASSGRAGAEISGALSALCDVLAKARVPVLNVCTLARNFMLMREEVAQVALDTLRTAVEQGASSSLGSSSSPSTSPSTAVELDEPPRKRPTLASRGQNGASPAGVRIAVAPSTVSIAVATLSVAALQGCAHAILALYILRDECARPTFQHLFEMGGEVSIAFEEAALDQLRHDAPESAAALEVAIAPTVARGWRLLDVTAPAGGDGVGILSAVTLPLASLPLLNISTLDHSYVLVQEAHLETALTKLKPSFDVVLTN